MPAHKQLYGDQWLHHPEHGAGLFYHHEVKEKLAEGWCYSAEDFGKAQPLEDMTRLDLIDIAKEAGIKVKANARKAEILEAINGSDE